MTTPLAAGRRPRSLRREDAIAIAKDLQYIPAGIRPTALTIVPQMGASEGEGQLSRAFTVDRFVALVPLRNHHGRGRLDPPRDAPITFAKSLDDRLRRARKSEPEQRAEVEGVDHCVVAPIVVEEHVKRYPGLACRAHRRHPLLELRRRVEVVESVAAGGSARVPGLAVAPVEAGDAEPRRRDREERRSGRGADLGRID